MSEPILTTNDLRKTFGDVEAVCGISFHVMKGEIFSLLGPNGAGKTTIISMLSGLLKPTGGTAKVCGYDIGRDLLAAKKTMGIVPQELALYDELTGYQNLSFWGQMYDIPRAELKSRIDEVLDLVGLVDRAGDRVETYSGGMKRRLNIAASLLHRPKLLFMDEPTVGIDPQSRRRILDSVKGLRDEGMTVFYTTHYMEEAEELSDRVGITDQGRLIALGTQKELTRMVGEQESLKLYPANDYDAGALAQLLEGVPGVLGSARLNGQVILTVDEAELALPGVITRANQADIRIRSIDIEEPNLEAVFLHLTGRALRD